MLRQKLNFSNFFFTLKQALTRDLQQQSKIYITTAIFVFDKITIVMLRIYHARYVTSVDPGQNSASNNQKTKRTKKEK